MRNKDIQSVPWYFQLLIVLYVFHTTLPAFGFYTPAAVHLFAVILLYVLLAVHNHSFSNDLGKVLPIFGITILLVFYAGWSRILLEFYGFVQLLLYPLLALYLIRTADYSVLKRIVFLVMLSYAVTSITTYYGCIKYPHASRFLATGMLDDGIDRSLFLKNNIGGFNFVYSLVLSIPFIICAIRNRKKNRLIKPPRLTLIIGVALIVIMGIGIVKSEYATALLFLVLELFLFFVPKTYKRKQVLWLLIIYVVLFVFIKDLLPELFKGLGENLESDVVNYRMEEIEAFSFSNSNENLEGDIGYRYEFYKKSFLAFTRSPIWGNPRANVGGHSYFFDNLGKLGLIGLVGMFVMFRQLFRVFYKPFKKESFYGFVLFVLAVALIMMVLNPKDNLGVLTFILPLSFTLLSNKTIINKCHENFVDSK